MGSMKPHNFAGVYFAVLLIAACSADYSATTARTVNCRNANDYRLVVVQNPTRKKDSGGARKN